MRNVTLGWYTPRMDLGAEDVRVLEDLARRAWNLDTGKRTGDDLDFLVWFYEADQFLRGGNIPEHLWVSFRTAFRLKGPHISDGEEDGAEFLKRLKVETVTGGLKNAAALFTALKKSLRPPERDARFAELLGLAEQLRRLTLGRTWSLYDVACGLWTSPVANLTAIGSVSPAPLIAQVLDNAVASQVAIMEILPRVGPDDIGHLVENFHGAVRTFEFGLKAVLDGLKTAENVDERTHQLYGEFTTRYGEFITKYEALARGVGKEISIARAPSLQTIRFGADDGPPSQGTFGPGQRKDALIAIRKILASAKERVRVCDNFVDSAILALLDENLENLNVEVLTTQRGLNQQPSFVAITKAHNDEKPGKIEIRVTDEVHDRFIVLDGARVYVLGASIKDAGKKAWSFRVLGEGEAAKALKGVLDPIWSRAAPTT